MLDAPHFIAAIGFVVRERALQIVGLPNNRGMQANRIFERELGPRADREVRGVRGIAEQHHLRGLAIGAIDAVVPGLAGDGWNCRQCERLVSTA